MTKMKKTAKKYKKVKTKTGLKKIPKENPAFQKFAMLFFGIGPILITIWVLFEKGFFNPI